MTNRQLTTSQLADLYTVTRQTAVDWVKSKKRFPNYQRLGKSYAVPASDVINDLDAKIKAYHQKIDELNELKLRVVEMVLEQDS